MVPFKGTLKGLDLRYSIAAPFSSEPVKRRSPQVYVFFA